MKDVADKATKSYHIQNYQAWQHIIKSENRKDLKRFLKDQCITDVKVYHLKGALSWGLELTVEAEMKYKLIYE